MFDDLFTGVLTIGLLASGAVAFGVDALHSGHAQATAVASLPAVTVVAHRAVPTQVVMLPTVHVTGHRHADAAVRVAGL